MDGLILLDEARAAGLSVRVEGDRLVIRGPRQAEPVARRLMANKAQVVLAALSPDWHVQWDERGAIMEADGGLSREQAEALALSDILDQMKRHGEWTP